MVGQNSARHIRVVILEKKKTDTFLSDYTASNHRKLYINYQLDALITIYSQNTILLNMFRASSAHPQEDIVVYKQHMVPSLSIRVLVTC